MTQETRELFDAYVDNELSADARAAFEAALDDDGDLRSDFDDFNESLAMLRNLPQQRVPDRFLLHVQQRIRKRTRGRYFNYYRQPSMVLEAAVCAILIFSMAAMYLMHIEPQKAAPDINRVERVLLAPADARFLKEFGAIDMVGTSTAGSDLQVHMEVSAEREPAIREALAQHPRLDLIATSVHRRDGMVWLKVRALPGPRKSPL